ncbi:MAG: hypothetical protein ABEI77_08485 [Halorientalis sp.]
MTRTLEPRVYLAVDRLTKLAGLLFVTAGIGGVGGPYSPVLIVAGLLVGVTTVFVDAAD